MRIWLFILAMALVTYLIRALPLTLFRQRIRNRWVRSFLYYVPYACLSAMTFPAIFFATQSVWSAAAGVAAALVLAFLGRSLVTVAAGACAAVLVVEQLLLPLL
ncbi:MAG: AzlD domain-containing protein [Gemmiger sp.]